jgi:gamma-glutamyltranspeptidase/glutathione hydrolase
MDNFLSILLLLLVLPLLVFSSDRTIGKNFTTRSEVIAQNGMAATSQPLATQVALDILKKGGSAVDAAIAANAILGLMEPTGCGIGGDLFAIVWDSRTNKLHGLNASGKSPASLTLEYFRKNKISQIPAYGPLPVSVPGCVDGWFELHEKFGTLSMEDILAPVIKYARSGYPVSEVIAWAWELNIPARKDFPGFMETYTINGHSPKKGEIFKNPDLANTLQSIAENGRDIFYKGKIAETISEYMKNQGGFLSYNDLASHMSEWVEPVSTNYRGYDIWELPPNGQGIAALQILNILEGYDLQSFGFGSKEYIHYFLEAKKLSFEDRAKFYADPNFNKLPTAQLISKSYAAERRKLIRADKAAKSYPPGNPQLENGDTIYLTVADKSGTMISLIQSNYRGMGSGMTPNGLGFCLQDRGELFTLEEGHYNTYEPGKRPFHTIIPAFVTKDEKPLISFGVMGGAMQPQGHAQILINMIDFGMNLQEAGDAPRIRHSGSSQPTGQKMTAGGKVYLESGFSAETLREIDLMGHTIQISTGGFGGYQAIMVDHVNKTFIGASESRKDGQAAGY